MGKPRLIILIRHAQSEGNKNRDIHQTTPDHRVKLTPEGWRQATEAGKKLRSLLRPDDTLHFFTSPYRRTRETTEGILSTLTSDDPEPSPFPRHTIKVYEEPRLREQDFGNFQPDSAEMTRMWHERASYGHFFYRIPNGESAADAYDRVSGFNESLWRSFSEDDFASVCVLVTHGLMTRVFLMKWYHWSVEYFEDLRNINHCEFIVMRQNMESGKFVLQNKLRTWTEWKRERQEEIRDGRASPIPMRKKWADAKTIDEEDEAKRMPQRQNTFDLFKDDDDKDDETRNKPLKLLDDSPELARTTSRRMSKVKPSRVSALRAGRDGGGSESGASESEDTEREDDRPARGKSMAMALHGKLGQRPSRSANRRPSVQELRASSMDPNARAEVLGDQTDEEEDERHRAKERKEDEEEFKRIREAEQSFAGAVR